MKKTFILITLLALLGKVTGFFREMAMAAKIGANVFTDIYAFSMTATGLFTTIILTGLNTAFIPVFADAEKEKKEQLFFNRLVSLLLVALFTLQILIIFFSKQIMSLVAPGLSENYRYYAITYSQLLSINLVTISFQALFSGYLQKQNRFLFPASISIPANIIMLVGIFLSSPSNITPLVIATILGHVASLIWLFVPLKRLKTRWKWDSSFFKDEYIKTFFVMVMPILLSIGATQINVVVDRSLSSLLPAGSASYLNYASKIQGIFYSIVIVSFTTVLFPKQSELASRENYKGILKLTSDNLSFLLLLVFPVTAGLMLLSQEISRVIYMRNQFTIIDAEITGNISFFYTGIILFQAISDMIAKMFFSMKETRKPMISTIAGVITNIILNFIFIRIWGLYGLAFATLISVIIRMVILIIYAKPLYKKNQEKLFNASTLKILFATVIMIIFLLLFRTMNMFNQVGDISFIMIFSIIGACIYFCFLYFLKTPELFAMLELFRGYLVRRQNKS